MMNDPRLASIGHTSLNNKQIHPITLPIPPPPLPPIFPPPNIPPPSFPFPPTFLPPPLTNTNHAFQSSCAPSTALWDTPCPPPEHQPSLTENESQEILKCWIRSKKAPEVVNKPNDSVKIYSIKEKLNAAYSLIKELETGARTLNVMVKTVAPYEWNQKCNEIEIQKRELLSVLNELKLSREDFHEIKQKCLKRSKKRARLQRQALRRKLEKENDKVNIQNLHFRIDNWQKEMQEVVERAKREKELQQEADAVLWGVRQRKSEARRQLELLSTLQELREARVKRRSAAGQSISTVEIQTFTTVIERLKALWSRYLSECQLEEQALRGVLAEGEVSEDAVATFKKLVLQEWHIALFGSGSTLESNSNLVEIRRSWDQFAVNEHTVLASTIPPGWVLPVPPSSNQWRSLLKY